MSVILSAKTPLVVEVKKINDSGQNQTRFLFKFWNKETYAVIANRNYTQATNAALARSKYSFPPGSRDIYVILSIIGKGYRNLAAEGNKLFFKNILDDFMNNEMLTKKDVMDICRLHGSGRDLRRMQEIFSDDFKPRVRLQGEDYLRMRRGILSL